MNRETAWDLLNEYTKNPALIRHGLCVEVVMRHYAKRDGADDAKWAHAGLLPDYDCTPSPGPPLPRSATSDSMAATPTPLTAPRA